MGKRGGLIAAVGAVAALLTGLAAFLGLFKADPQPVPGPITVAPQPVPQSDDATIFLSYTSNAACTPTIVVTVSGIETNPTTPRFPVTDVPLGRQPYAASGRIDCDDGFVCGVNGAGYVDIVDGRSYAIDWMETGSAVCTVTVTS